MGSHTANSKGRRQIMTRPLAMSVGDDLDNDDVRFDETALMDDHIAGIHKKWDCIEDEIWAKIVIMEKTQEVAKAFIRAPVMTVNGGDFGFDEEIIGLSGFNNTLRDGDTKRVLDLVGDGCRMKMDDGGNILVERKSKEKLFCIGPDNGIMALELEKPQILFDMRKYQHTISKEMRKVKPDWGKVRRKAICSISFVDQENLFLDQPVWLLIINIVALDFLRSKIGSTKEEPNYENVKNTEDDGKEEDLYFSGLGAKVRPANPCKPKKQACVIS